MIHRDCSWDVSHVDSPEELATILTETTWTINTAFRVRSHPDYLFLNDSASPDGIQEYAIVKTTGREGYYLQIESLTIDNYEAYCAKETLRFIRDFFSGRIELPKSPQWEQPFCLEIHEGNERSFEPQLSSDRDVNWSRHPFPASRRSA